MGSKACFKRQQQGSKMVQAQPSARGGKTGSTKPQVGVPADCHSRKFSRSLPRAPHGHRARCLPSPGALRCLAQPLRGSSAPPTQPGPPPRRAVASSGSRQRCGPRDPQAGLPRVQSVGRPKRTLPYACPGPRKASIPGPDGLRPPRRAHKWSLGLRDGTDSRRMMLDHSRRETHRHEKMAERGREGRAHGVMGSGQAIARFSKHRQKR